MDRYFLPALAFSSLLDDALTVVGIAIALIIGFVFINFGLLLPGLFTWLDGCHRDSRNEYVEFGPVAAPIISDPAPSGIVSREMNPNPEPVVQPHPGATSSDTRPRLCPPGSSRQALRST
jgi:hypothetical protein